MAYGYLIKLGLYQKQLSDQLTQKVNDLLTQQSNLKNKYESGQQNIGIAKSQFEETKNILPSNESFPSNFGIYLLIGIGILFLIYLWKKYV